MLTGNKHPNFSHANIIIIDLYKKNIERYEPYGKESWISPGKPINTTLDNKFKNILLQYFNLTDYKYLSPIDISPKIGMQTKADAYKGMCVTYCLAYLQLRIMNPDMSQNDIVSYFSKKTKEQLKDIILRYARYVEDTLKDMSSSIRKNAYDLYNIKLKEKVKYLIIDKNGNQIIKVW